MDEQSLIRHYLPAIAAFVAFVLFALFFPFAEPADKLGEKFDIKAQVAGAAGDFCGLNPVTGTVNLELETWTPQFADKDQGGLIGWRSDGPKDYSPPIRIVKIAGCYRCVGTVHFWTKNSAGTYTELTGANMPMELIYFKDYDYSTAPGGGILVDRITADVMNDPWPASIAKYTITKDPVPYTINGLTEKKDGANWVDEKTISEILGGKVNAHNVDTEAKSKTYQTARISSVSNVKAAFDSITTVPAPKETTDFSKKLFACKNTIRPGDNVCDFESECTVAAQCQDGIDNETPPDGKIDFPNDPGCSSAADNNEGDEAQCQDGKDNEPTPDGKIDFPNDPGCSSPTDTNEGDEQQCKDGIDNDKDGRIDLADPGCKNDPNGTNENAEEECQNTFDDDKDGKADYPDDPGCSSKTDNNEGDETQCKDKIDNDSDGRADFVAVSGMPKDPGCSSPDDPDESDEEACQDTKDNDKDGKIDYPDDVGCLNPKDTSEENPQCSDGLDNDKDGKIDLADKGCETEKDDDEKNQIIGRDAQVSSSKKPKLIILPELAEDEKVTFKTDCKDCVLETSKDPALFIGGTTASKANFYIIGTLVAADKTQSHTVVAVGNYAEEVRLFSRDGIEYTSLGENSYAQYFPSFLAGEENNYAFKIKTSTGFELVKTTAEAFLPSKAEPFQNGGLYYFLLSGTDSEGRGHLMIVRGRYWDLKTLKDKAATNEALLNLMNVKGNLLTCINRFQNLSEFHSLFTDAAAFQMFLDLLSLCQRG